MDKTTLGYLNPAIVYASISGIDNDWLSSLKTLSEATIYLYSLWGGLHLNGGHDLTFC